MTLTDLMPFVNHLWQSTLFAAAIWLLVLMMRKNSAAVRHRLWLAASMKFLIPFSVLVSFGSRFQWRTIVLSESAGAFTAPDRLVLSTVLALLRKGATVPVEAWARDNSVRLATGVLTATDNQIDTTTGTLRLKAVFDNRDHALFPNQFVNVRLFITP